VQLFTWAVLLDLLEEMRNDYIGPKKLAKLQASQEEYQNNIKALRKQGSITAVALSLFNSTRILAP
jgi:hypothetical protein